MLRQRRAAATPGRQVRTRVPNAGSRALPAEPSLDVRQVSIDHVWLAAVRHDPIEQRVDGHHLLITNSGIRLAPRRRDLRQQL